MNRTPLPKIKTQASANWVTFETIAPITPVPIKLTLFDPKKRRSAYMDIADKKVPAREKRKIYENRVPVIRACPITLIAANTIKAWKGKISRASISGRFAMPMRINGMGLGIIYSIVERKKQKAPRRARVFRVSGYLRFAILSASAYITVNFYFKPGAE
jgi:hypothetical protein